MKFRKFIIYFIPAFLLIIVLSAGFLLKNANTLLKHELEKFLGENFSVGHIGLSCNGVDADTINLLLPDKRTVFKADLISLKAAPLGILKGENKIASLSLDSPYLLLEQDRNGNILFPLPARKDSRKKDAQKPKVFIVSSLSIQKGSLDYIDRKVSSSAAPVRLRDIQLAIRNIGLPSENIMSDYDLTATLPGKLGTGTVKSKGRFNAVSKDSTAKIMVRNLDITGLRQYYQKKGDVEVTKGFVSVDADISIVSSYLKSSGKIVIKDLQFNSGSGSQFLGLPLLAVIKLLKDNNNEISLDFTMEGDLKNPKFSISDSIVQKMTITLARMMGMPIEMIGKSVFRLGGDMLKNVFK